MWQIHETFPVLCANFFYKNRHFSQGTKFISCVYRRSTKSSYRLLSTTNLPKVYQKTWFFMILESCCNSVFFNFWCSKSSKNRAKKGTNDHKRDQSTSTIYKLKIPRSKIRTGSSPVSGTKKKGSLKGCPSFWYWFGTDLNLSSSGQRQLQKLELLQLLIEDGLEPFKLRTAAAAKA